MLRTMYIVIARVYSTRRAKRAVCIPNLNRVKIEAEGRCYLPTRLRYHGRVLARYQFLLLIVGANQKPGLSHVTGRRRGVASY